MKPWKRFKWPKSEGLGALMALFLGGFMAYVWFEIFLKTSLGCAKTEALAFCFREWTGVILPLVGILISAALLYKQIRLTRAQVAPLAVEYLERRNSNIDKVRTYIFAIKTHLELLGIILDTSMKISEIAEVEKTVTSSVDVVKMAKSVMKCHFTENTTDICNSFFAEWNRIDLEFKILGNYIAAINQGDTAASQLVVAKGVISIKNRSEVLLKTVNHVAKTVNEIYRRNQKTMIELGGDIYKEADSGGR